jgi:hypothetical protein
MVMGSLRVPLLSAQSADETTSEGVDCSGFPNVAIYVIGAGTTSSGVITIEEADYNPATAASAPYTGTWSAVTTVNASDVTGGAQVAVHLGVGAYGYVRTRISTVIGGGGTISTVLRAC